MGGENLNQESKFEKYKRNKKLFCCTSRAKWIDE